MRISRATSGRSEWSFGGLIQSARNAAASAVNLLQVLTNFEIGRRIVEHEQKGARRAGYGQEMLKTLSSRLTEEFGKGFSVTKGATNAEVLPGVRGSNSTEGFC